MWYSCMVVGRISCFAAVLSCVGAASLQANSVSPAEPFTRIYDVPVAEIAALSEKAVLKPSGWMAIKEDDTTHRFKGCAVFMNDKIVAVLGKNRPGVDL